MIFSLLCCKVRSSLPAFPLPAPLLARPYPFRLSSRFCLGPISTDQIHQVILPLGLLTLPDLASLLVPRDHLLGIPSPSKFLPESPQPAGLIRFDVQELLGRRVPESGVTGVFRGGVDGGGGGGALGVGAAVGKGDELGEGVGTFGAADQGCVTELLVANGGFGLANKG